MGKAKRERQKAARAIGAGEAVVFVASASPADQSATVKETFISAGGDIPGLLLAVAAAEHAFELARAKRDRALLAALKVHTLGQVGELLGMTRQAVADRQRRATGVVRGGRL